MCGHFTLSPEQALSHTGIVAVCVDGWEGPSLRSRAGCLAALDFMRDLAPEATGFELHVAGRMECGMIADTMFWQTKEQS